jgi:hypothetical protein
VQVLEEQQRLRASMGSSDEAAGRKMRSLVTHKKLKEIAVAQASSGRAAGEGGARPPFRALCAGTLRLRDLLLLPGCPGSCFPMPVPCPSQAEEIRALAGELDRLRLKTYPTFGACHCYLSMQPTAYSL